MKRRDENAPFWQQMRQAERSIIEFALVHGGTLAKTAALLGISPNYLSERTRDLGIPTPDSKPGPKPGTKPVRATRPDLRVVNSDAASDEVTEAIQDDAETAAAEDEEGDEDEEGGEDEGYEDEEEEDDEDDGGEDEDDKQEDLGGN